MNGFRKVFISYDTRDFEIADSFVNMLEEISENKIEIFIAENKKSENGIKYGEEWYSELIKKINNSDVVIVILTNRSLSSKWVLFESGYSKGLGKKVFGLNLLQNYDLKMGPFNQIQNCQITEKALTKLVSDLLNIPFKIISGNKESKKHITDFNLAIKSFNRNLSIEHRLLNKIDEDSHEMKMAILNKKYYKGHNFQVGWRFMFNEFTTFHNQNSEPAIMRDFTVSSHSNFHYEHYDFDNYYSLIRQLLEEKTLGKSPIIRFMIICHYSSDLNRNKGAEKYLLNVMNLAHGDISSARELFTILNNKTKGTFDIEFRFINYSIVEYLKTSPDKVMLLDNPFNVYSNFAASKASIVKSTSFNKRKTTETKQRLRIPNFEILFDEKDVQNCLNTFDFLWQKSDDLQKLFLNCSENDLMLFGSGQLFNNWAKLDVNKIYKEKENIEPNNG